MGTKDPKFLYEYKLTNLKTGEEFVARGWKAVTQLAGLKNCNQATMRKTKKWLVEVVGDPEEWDESAYRLSLYNKTKSRYPDYEKLKQLRDPLFEKRKRLRLKGWLNIDGTPFTAEQHDEMLQLSCEVCGDSEQRNMCVDHCHVTNVVRGVLCRRCNLALGFVSDNIDHLHKLVEYLQNHKEKLSFLVKTK